MLRGWTAVVAGLAVSALPGAALATGPWTTLLKASSYTDLASAGDTVWCATLEAGLLRFSVSSGEFDAVVREPGGLASNRLTTLAFDRSRRLWIGTQGAGVSFLAADGTSWGLLNEFDGLPSDTVTVLETAGDTVWIGTPRGIALWDGHEIAGVLPDGSNPSPFASNEITGVAELAGDLWVATASGVYRSALSSGLALWTAVNSGLPTRSVAALASDGSSLLALDGKRVQWLDPGAGMWTQVGGLGDVFALSDDLGTVTASSRQGIFRWNGGGWDSVHAGLISGATRDSVFAVAAGRDGRFFAANGLGLFDQPAGPGPWRQTIPPGPPGNDILNLDLEGPRIYVTTDEHGVGRYDGTSWKHWVPSRGVV